jgi:hypothetical protein
VRRRSHFVVEVELDEDASAPSSNSCAGSCSAMGVSKSSAVAGAFHVEGRTCRWASEATLMPSALRGG